MNDFHEEDFEEERDDNGLEELRQRAASFSEEDNDRTACRLYAEVERRAKSENDVAQYVYAMFFQMLNAQNLMDFEYAREKAISLIALFEDEEQARRVQPDLNEDEFEWMCGWMRTCVYEGLADVTGEMQGYNSPGMQSCIADGLQVCRRVGKLQCLQCFREYTSYVYAASDDLEMAMHQRRQLIEHQGEWADRGNLRPDSFYELGRFQLLQGNIQGAIELVTRARHALVNEPDVNCINTVRRNFMPLYETLRVLSGERDANLPRTETPDPDLSQLPKGEHVLHEYRWDLFDAVRACVLQDYDKAIELLTEWDRFLSERDIANRWFEVRLRLIAAYSLAGKEKRVTKLAEQLTERAQKACDYLTLRRLGRILDPEQDTTPVALLAPVSIGPYATVEPAPVAADPKLGELPPPSEAKKEEDNEEDNTPFKRSIDAFMERMKEAEDDEAKRAAILNDMLKVTPEQTADVKDACWLVHLVRYVIDDFGRAEEIWVWAKTLARPHNEDATMLSLMAVMADVFRDADETMEKRIPPIQVEKLFEKSIRLDPDKPRNFMRAGSFYLHDGRIDEAERCFARGFRLDRSDSILALRLAELYGETDRARDGLQVLDMCMREGNRDPNVAWEAALMAMGLDQYASMLTYLEVFEAETENETWVNYYRATALVELDRAEEALAACDEEQCRSPEQVFPLEVLRTRACVMLNRFDAANQHLTNVLKTPLRTIDYLTFSGLNRIFERLWRTVTDSPEPLANKAALDEYLLVSGLLPDEFFDRRREDGEVVEGVNFYHCVVKQPLDQSWSESNGCLTGQESWDHYNSLWGVLAQNEEEASQFVIAEQQRCFKLAPAVLETSLEAEDFMDTIGVVWQGVRWCEQDEDKNE